MYTNSKIYIPIPIPIGMDVKGSEAVVVCIISLKCIVVYNVTKAMP